jgi:hypothetical protein
MRISTSMENFWTTRAGELMQTYRDLIAATAGLDSSMRMIAIVYGIISSEDVLHMKDGLFSLLKTQPLSIFGAMRQPHLLIDFYNLANSNYLGSANSLALLGRMIIGQRGIPPIREPADFYLGFRDVEPSDRQAPLPLSAETYLGAAAVLLMCIEGCSNTDAADFMFAAGNRDDKFSDLYAYIDRRYLRTPELKARELPLPDLPVPQEFQQVFRDWAEGDVNFTVSAPE